MSHDSLRTLHSRLVKDTARSSAPFSKNMLDVSNMAHRPHSSDAEVVRMLNAWCLTHDQSCQFGKVAASRQQLVFCVLRMRDLERGDEFVERKIADEKLRWMRRAVAQPDYPPHGFIVACLTPELEAAAPDDNLRRFAERLQAAAKWEPAEPARPGENPVVSAYLFMSNPDADTFLGYRFNIDFFAAAGHERWWHDHHFPAGIALTANSTGHMKAYRERANLVGPDWTLTQAMKTIETAHPTKTEPTGRPAQTAAAARAQGRVMWLLDLEDGKPVVEHLTCPFKKSVPSTLATKDWTKYDGWLHTDHAVRAEFFDGHVDPAAVPGREPTRNDLTYLHDNNDPAEGGFRDFIAGKLFTAEEVYALLGKPHEWVDLSAPSETVTRTQQETDEVEHLLAIALRWETEYSPED